MGKHEVGTPKYIANKIKAKGLQKLRWFCQMCEKQCRDENGFKCHTMSESHQRQLLLFADNANKYMDQFSKEFSQGYLNLLKRQFGTRRVPANRVYQEYITDRNHMHMNATMWLTLTEYVKWLGRTGQCVVDETEKGWFVTYIDRDPETIAAQEKKSKKQKMDKDDEERMMEFIEKQVERGQQEADNSNETIKVPLQRPENDGPLCFKLNLKPKSDVIKDTKTTKKDLVDEESKSKKRERSEDRSKTEESQKKTKIEKHDREKAHKEEGWLREGLMVKVMTKKLGERYYKSKGIVCAVENQKFVGKIKLKTPEEVEGHVIKLDQEHVETVIPALGKEVLILWGHYRNAIATVKKLHIEDYSLDVELTERSKTLKRLPYEQVCKFVR